MSRKRGIAVRALVVAASALLVLAVVAGYVRHVVVDADQVANRASAALRDDAVRSLVAAQVTDELVLANEADLLAARPIIESVAAGVVGSRAFTGLFGSAVRDVHRAVLDRDRNTVTLTVADVGTVVAAALERIRPELARQVEASGRVELLQRSLGDGGAAAIRAVDRIRVLAWLLLAAFLVTAGAALALARDRRQVVVRLGVGAALGGVLLAVLCVAGRGLALGGIGDPDAREAAGAVWDAFLGDLRSTGWLLAAAGAVVAASAASLLRPAPLGAPLRRAVAFVATEPTRPHLRVLRGAVFIAAGIVLLTSAQAVLVLAVHLAGVYLVYEGAAALLRMTARPEAAPAPERPGRRRRVAVPVTVAAALGLALAVFLASGQTTTAAPARGACNGHAELCAKPLDEVVLPATHNSMSVPLPGWFAAEQDAPIPDQLRAGVRGLLVDTYYADRLPNGRVRTVIDDTSKLRAKAREDGIGEETFEAALRIRARVGFEGDGERGMYLCHTLCEVGATPLAEMLDDLRDFLVANPGEVVVLVNQDAVTPEDFVGAVREAGLEDLVHRGEPGGRWPTLGAMVDSGRRLVVLAENEAGVAPWYRLMYDELVEETPFDFRSVRALTDRAGLAATCRPNRGPEGAPLFLVNHWVSTDPTPRPSHADAVNARPALLARVRECERLRDHLPTLLAVNFFARGDLFAVVDELNGL